MLNDSARILFVEMMGVPGSYDASVYDHFEDKDQEGRWFVKRYSHLAGISISTRNPCLGEALPAIGEIDGLVLAGSYNSVHDDTDWQRRMRAWLPGAFDAGIPVLGICGSHQLIAHMAGAAVERLADGPYAGTFPLHLTEAGRVSPLMAGIEDGDSFHYANGEQVVDLPPRATLLGWSSRAAVAALDYGRHCYTTQFHPEATEETLGTIWQFRAPELMRRYHPRDRGDRLVENFLCLARDLRAKRLEAAR